MTTVRLLSILLIGSFIITLATPSLVQAEDPFTYQEFREVVDLFFSVE